MLGLILWKRNGNYYSILDMTKLHPPRRHTLCIGIWHICRLLSEPCSVRERSPGRQIGLAGIVENRMETTIVYRGHMGIMENKKEASIVYRGFMGIMENKMETTIVCVDHLRLEQTLLYCLSVQGGGSP